jgi:hypothetical protein
MIELLYLEFPLGVQFSCPCVKRGVTYQDLDNKGRSKRSSFGVFLKVDLKLRSVFKTKILVLVFISSHSILCQINPASNITYLFFQWSTVLQKLTRSQLVRQFPAFSGTRRFITAFTKARQLSLS